MTGFLGQIVTDSGKPDGALLKRMDVSRLIEMGWRARIDLREGIEDTYRWHRAQSPDKIWSPSGLN